MITKLIEFNVQLIDVVEIIIISFFMVLGLFGIVKLSSVFEENYRHKIQLMMMVATQIIVGLILLLSFCMFLMVIGGIVAPPPHN